MSARRVKTIARVLLLAALVGALVFASCKRKSATERALDETKQGLQDLGKATAENIKDAAHSPAAQKAAGAVKNAAGKAKDALNNALQ